MGAGHCRHRAGCCSRRGSRKSRRNKSPLASWDARPILGSRGGFRPSGVRPASGRWTSPEPSHPRVEMLQCAGSVIQVIRLQGP